jgi:serine protease Do
MSRTQILLVVVMFSGIITGFLCSHFAVAPANLPAYETEKEKLEKELAGVPAPSERFVAVARLVTPAVVNITTKGEQVVRDPFSDMEDDFFGEFFKRFRRQWRSVPVISFGSGIIVTNEGHVLTNSHVVRGATEVAVKLGDKREFTAKVLGSDPKTDLAILKIDDKNLPYAELGDSDKIQVGEWVLAIGNPFGLEQTVTAGIISAKGRANVGIADYEDFIQTDAAINPGNSGGPLANMEGKVIGINSAIVSRTGGYLGIGFAIPSNMAKAVMKDLVSQGTVRRGWLGISMIDLTPAMAKELGVSYTPGVLVDEVVADSPAAKEGVKKDDIIVGFNDTEVASASQLRNVIATTEVGSKVKLKIARGKEKIDIEVKVVLPPEEIPLRSGQNIKELGISVADLSWRLAKQFGYEEKQGVLVTDVDRDGLAASLGVEKGDLLQEINGKEITSVAQLQKVIPSIDLKGRLTLQLKSGNATKILQRGR